MQNVIVFRSAKHPVVQKCIEFIKTQYKDACIWLIVQEECADIYKIMDHVHLIEVNNGYIQYKYMKNSERVNQILPELLHAKAFVPYSTARPECEEIENILMNILKINHVTFYDIYGKTQQKNIRMKRIFKNMLFIVYYIKKRIVYVLLKILYNYFALHG